MIVAFRKAALADIQTIYDYIAKDNPASAQRVVRRIRDATKRLELFPLSGRLGAVEGTHELVVPALPYVVVYEIAPDHVEIIAVFHAAQNLPRARK
jgi:addiction module RelE/StbE family toxin